MGPLRLRRAVRFSRAAVPTCPGTTGHNVRMLWRGIPDQTIALDPGDLSFFLMQTMPSSPGRCTPGKVATGTSPFLP